MRFCFATLAVPFSAFGAETSSRLPHAQLAHREQGKATDKGVPAGRDSSREQPLGNNSQQASRGHIHQRLICLATAVDSSCTCAPLKVGPTPGSFCTVRFSTKAPLVDKELCGAWPGRPTSNHRIYDPSAGAMLVRAVGRAIPSEKIGVGGRAKARRTKSPGQRRGNEDKPYSTKSSLVALAVGTRVAPGASNPHSRPVGRRTNENAAESC